MNDNLHRPKTAEHTRVPIVIEEALGAAAMAIICVISLANVVVRYLTNVSFAFTEEYSVFLLAFMTFVGASAAFATGEHIRITFFVERMSHFARKVCSLLSTIVTVITFSLVLFFGAQVTYDEWYWGETSAALGSPTWVYSIWLPLLSAAIIGRVIGRALAEARGRA